MIRRGGVGWGGMVAAARHSLCTLQLRGSVECDGTSLRLLHVSPRNPHLKSEVLAWKSRHAGEPLPKHFNLRIRICGAAERGDGGRVVVIVGRVLAQCFPMKIGPCY